MENSVNFIGTGKQTGNKIQISFDWETLKKLSKAEFNGKKYLILDVIPLKNKDKYKRTHTIVEHVPYKAENN